MNNSNIRPHTAEALALGTNLTNMRLHAGMMQKELAESVCLSPSALSGYESGRRIPDVGTVLTYIEAMEQNLDEGINYEHSYLVEGNKITLTTTIEVPAMG